MTNIVKYKLQKGISLIEALVSTAIVAIGFLAVFQLVNYSVNSIDVSAERTKINYITSMTVSYTHLTLPTIMPV